MDSVLTPNLAKVGVEIVRVKKSQFATVDLYRNDDILMPMYTATGKLPTLCSNEWKRRVIMRYLRSLSVKEARVWMGISADEMQRVRMDSPPKWFQMYYPLVFDVRMRRVECVALVESMGWPKPPRSSCWMCPNMGDAEWRELSNADLAKAAALELEIQAKDPELFLHKSQKHVLSQPFNDSLPGDESECQTGFCFV